MSDEERLPLTDEAEASCPLPQTHGRLDQAHRLWHRTLEGYSDGDEFVLELNNAIQGLRNVTFILQSEMGNAIREARAWYEPWQKRMRADPVMKWLHDARTQVVKRGDLETHSTARVSLLADWWGARPLVEFEIPPFVPPALIAAHLPELDLPDQVRKEGVLEVERRWVEAGLPDWELLDALAHCYGALRTIVADAHGQCGFRMDTVEDHEGIQTEWSVDHLGGRLPCMVVSEEARKARLLIATGELVTPGTHEIAHDPAAYADAQERYGLDNVMSGLDLEPEADPLIRQAELFVEVGKKMLAVDKEHTTLCWLYGANGSTVIQLEVRDQAEKYIGMDRVAEQVRLLAADRLIFITEAWMAPATDLAPGQRPGELESPGEALCVHALSARGPEFSRQWITPFTRAENGEIVFGETESGWLGFPQFLAPVLMVWEELLPSEDRRDQEGADDQGES